MSVPEQSFAQNRYEGHLWVTLATGEYYPDILPKACELYEPVLRSFSRLLKSSASSADFFRSIAAEPETWMRVQLARVFRKYVCPEAPVEMLKRKASLTLILEQFGPRFRPIIEVQRAFEGRPLPDEALCALLWEYKDRGKKGYDLTEKLFSELRRCLPGFTVHGPERAGKDVPLGRFFPDCPHPKRPIDFVITEGLDPLAIGLARYDSDRGGAQEDDRIGQYRECADEVIRHTDAKGLRTKVLFVNDGPGLLLGSMWEDYSALESRWPGRAQVLTLRMVPYRIRMEWLRS